MYHHHVWIWTKQDVWHNSHGVMWPTEIFTDSVQNQYSTIVVMHCNVSQDIFSRCTLLHLSPYNIISGLRKVATCQNEGKVHCTTIQSTAMALALLQAYWGHTFCIEPARTHQHNLSSVVLVTLKRHMCHPYLRPTMKPHEVSDVLALVVINLHVQVAQLQLAVSFDSQQLSMGHSNHALARTA